MPEEQAEEGQEGSGEYNALEEHSDTTYEASDSDSSGELNPGEVSFLEGSETSDKQQTLEEMIEGPGEEDSIFEAEIADIEKANKYANMTGKEGKDPEKTYKKNIGKLLKIANKYSSKGNYSVTRWVLEKACSILDNMILHDDGIQCSKYAKEIISKVSVIDQQAARNATNNYLSDALASAKNGQLKSFYQLRIANDLNDYLAKAYSSGLKISNRIDQIETALKNSTYRPDINFANGFKDVQNYKSERYKFKTLDENGNQVWEIGGIWTSTPVSKIQHNCPGYKALPEGTGKENLNQPFFHKGLKPWTKKSDIYLSYGEARRDGKYLYNGSNYLGK